MRPKNPVIFCFQLLTVNAKHLGFYVDWQAPQNKGMPGIPP